MKIYTRTGDKGTTAIVGGQRLPKNHPRIEAYGTVDELNSWLGLIASSPQCPATQRHTITAIQSILFDIGAQLAGSPDTTLTPQHILALETDIDRMDTILPPLTRFILPGGSPLSAQTNIARTVCRRAERLITPLEPHPLTLQFINRLSDWLFTLARLINMTQNVAENFWQKNCTL